jgi:DNA mismatch endonuclease, patch repair protein
MAVKLRNVKRSEVMSRIRGRDNKDTELALAKLFRRNKITGWRRHQTVFGKPDFIFPKLKLAMFVDGCFWHGCPKHATKPKNNRAFWERKLTANKRRDRLVNQTLRRAGWRVLRIWEHALRQATMERATKRRATKKPQNEARLLNRIHKGLSPD